MRRFIAGLCCLIVGFEVLVTVSAVVTLTILGLWTGGFELEATIPPPQEVAVSVQPSSAASEAPALEAALESRQRNGSALASSALCKDDPPGQADRDFAAAFQFVASEAKVNQFEIPLAANPQDPAPVDGSINVNAIVITPARPPVTAECDPKSAIATAVHQLYAWAEQQESDGQFDRADELRGLARALRREMNLNLSGTCAAPAPLPAHTAVEPASASPALEQAAQPSGAGEAEAAQEAAKPDSDRPRVN